jgi:hypothetical protein
MPTAALFSLSVAHPITLCFPLSFRSISRSLLPPLSHRPHTHRKNQTQFIRYYILLSHGLSDRFSCNPATCTTQIPPPLLSSPPTNHLYSAKTSILIYIASSACFPMFRLSLPYQTFVTISFHLFRKLDFFFQCRLFFLLMSFNGGGFSSGFFFLFSVGWSR